MFEQQKRSKREALIKQLGRQATFNNTNIIPKRPKLFVSTGNADFTPMVDYTEVQSFHSDESSLMDIKSSKNLNSD